MPDDLAAVSDRVARTVRERITPALYRDAVPLRVEGWVVPGEPVPVASALAATWTPAAVGDAWGRPWSTWWLRLTGDVPSGWAGRAVEAVVDLGFDPTRAGFQAEGLAYTLDGRPIKGIAPRSAHVPLGPAPAGGTLGLLVEAAANPDLHRGGSFAPTPDGDRATAGTGMLYRLRRADLALLDPTVWELAADVAALDGLAATLAPGDPRRHLIRRALEDMLDVLDPDAVGASAGEARTRLAGALSRPAAASAHRVFAVGHAHIDSAWLWPLRETARKVVRTFTAALQLMDEHPDLVFACSQVQHLAWVRDGHPDVWERIRHRVGTGQWVVVGGMWVEPDANLPGGEAMVRQFVTGKAFLRDELGVEPEEVWLPDSFGYSAALPQIARLAGCRWFVTQKLSWNATNRMPHHTFWWEGIDGSRVFTHFPPVDTYNAELSPAELAHASARFADHGEASMSLVPFGYGDGGGGPTREMLGAARRAADLEGSPRVRLASPRQFFEAAEAEHPDAPVWRGEMYLEAHRGTLTSQGRTKRGNRRAEHLLREAELWSAHAAVAGRRAYPYDELDAAWKTVLLHQFHDILPGSSIAWVHDDTEKAHAEVAARLEEVAAAAVTALAGAGDVALAFNAGPFGRDGVPALGGATVPGAGRPASVTSDGAGRWVVDNTALRVVVDADGLVVSVHDHATGREVIAPGGAGNRLQLHRDVPARWDAWDVDAHHRRVRTDLTAVDEVDPVPGGVRVRRSFATSAVTQTLTLPARPAGGGPAGRWLDVVTEVDWHERQKLLKLSFDLDVHAERFAAETQFGHVWRPTHANTSWDEARFEVCAHRFVHVGEPGFGVGIANDGTYGHAVTRTTRPDGGTTTTVRLSLLRAPTYPDPAADQGRHVLRHRLVVGDLPAALEAGYDLNLALRLLAGAGPVPPLVAVDDPAVVVEAVKLAEDRSGDVVVRLYEASGGRAAARLGTGFDLAGAVETDLLERPAPDRALTGRDGGGVTVALRPFQIVTLRLQPAI